MFQADESAALNSQLAECRQLADRILYVSHFNYANAKTTTLHFTPQNVIQQMATVIYQWFKFLILLSINGVMKFEGESTNVNSHLFHTLFFDEFAKIYNDSQLWPKFAIFHKNSKSLQSVISPFKFVLSPLIKLFNDNFCGILNVTFISNDH